MAEIRVLDNTTIDQIAAGEVIERPVSVVKELVENALDAGADQITVELVDGGLSLIRVTDNGCGIPKEEVRKAFLRHATSKIRDASDLFNLSTLGFRGEALSSIASVARVELITKRAEELSGTRYVIEGGEEKAFEEVGAPEGTSFMVSDLFFNTPVRRKFMKAPATEASYVATLMEQLSLCRSGIAMRLILNGKVKLQTTGSYKMKDIIFTLYGRETAKMMQPLRYEEHGMRLVGYIGAPALTKGNRSGELTFVNGRFVKSPLLLKAIEQAYHGLTMQHKFPMAILQLEMDASMLDVNVHPTKMEVRFRAEKDVFDIVYHGIRETLFARDQIPTVSVGAEEKAAVQKPEAPVSAPKAEAAASSRSTEAAAAVRSAEALREEKTAAGPKQTSAPKTEERAGNAKPFTQSFVRDSSIYDYKADEDRRLLERILSGNMPSPEKAAAEAKAQAASEPQEAAAAKAQEQAVSKAQAVSKPQEPAAEKPEKLQEQAAEQPPAAEKQPDLFTEKVLEAAKEASFRLIGQVFETYWLMEYEGQLLIADQHAVHEKILYERTMKQLSEKEATSQRLMPPRMLTLTAAEEAALRKYRETFERLGFEISELGGREYGLSAVPDNLFGLSAEGVFNSLLTELADEREIPVSMIEAKVAMMSCKAAVKGGQKLSFAEAEALLKELLTLENPYACPHGRPTVIRITEQELEKKFKRII